MQSHNVNHDVFTERFAWMLVFHLLVEKIILQLSIPKCQGTFWGGVEQMYKVAPRREILLKRFTMGRVGESLSESSESSSGPGKRRRLFMFQSLI